MPYTENLITNPSFEVDTTGYTPFSGAKLFPEYTNSLYGSNSMRVETNGSTSGQGFYTPQVTEFHTAAYSGSVYLQGTDHIYVEVDLVLNPGGTVLVSKTIQLTEDWQRVSVSNGATGESGEQNVYMIVRTVSPVATIFWVDGVQIEKNSKVTEYCDGDQYGCYWTGDPNASTSVRDVEFALTAEGFNSSNGSIEFIIPGEIFDVTAVGENVSSGSIEFNIIDRPGAFDDFAVFGLNDIDPAMAYVRQTNAGTLSGEYGQSYARQYGLFVPPVDYQVSGGLAWKRAQYASVAFKYAGVTSGNWQYIDAVQLEPHHVDDRGANYSSSKRYHTGDLIVYNNKIIYVALQDHYNQSPTGTNTDNAYWQFVQYQYGPSPYTTPRQIKTIIKPNRLNFVKNPSFESSLNYWYTNDADIVISRDDSSVTPVHGTFSMKVSVPDADIVSPGVYINIDKLIVGRTYTVSAYVQGSTSIEDLIIRCGTGNTSVSGQGIPYGGYRDVDNPDNNIGYSQGPYGGKYPSGDANNFPPGTWIRSSFSFVATSDNEDLTFLASFIEDADFPALFWIDAVMIEESELVGSYFDGSFGYDYLWESGGTAGESRSYYYEGRRTKTYIIDEILKDNTPLGITAAEPVFAVPYSQ